VFELVNPTHQRLFPERQLLGRPILEALPEIADNPTYQTLRQVYKTGITHEEYELLIPLSRPEDGALEDRYFRYIQQARHDDQGRVDGILVFAFELTGQVNDRKTAEEKARQFNFLANAMPQKVWTALPDGEVNYCNQQWLEYTGLSANELVGWAWKDIIHPEDWKENAKVWQHSLATGERFQLEQRIKSKGGAYRWHLSRALAHYDHQGAISMWVGTNTDIHDQKLTEQALQVLTRELTAANESILTSNEHLAAMNRQLTHINADLDNFIYAASHDLKAPISNIEMLVEELLLELPKESLGREAAHIISLIRGAIDRFKKTIGNMTEISKLQKDNSKEVTLVNLAEIVAEVKLDLEPLIAKSDIRIGTDLNDHPLVSFSEKNMRSIVYNLLSNAIKYRHPEREPGVRISSGEEGDYFVLVVQDNGLGLSLDQQGKLFGMFRRFHDHVEGSGVGLYMVKRIVDNAGGKIKVESRPGEGSTFSVFLKKNAWEAAKPSMPPSGEN
jgi:PAS domain S-box-containing protein